MKTYDPDQTIAAIATPPGNGAIAGIRVSGKNAFSVVNKIFSKNISNLPSHTAHYGKILSSSKNTLDHVLILIMRAPRSYTGDDTVEIFCHGGAVNTRRILDRVCEAGASPAKPGAFTHQAFMNGKIDLTQAEAVQEFIMAENELSLRASEAHLDGALSKLVRSFQNELTELASVLEAWVDFPEEGLEFLSFEAMLEKLNKTEQRMRSLLETFHEGKIIKEGISLCLIGKPNAGKSSLMNALLGKDRAIVTETPGTTRDILEEDLMLGLLHFKLIDTAGIRTTEEMIEKEGIKRAEKALQTSDLTLLVMDPKENQDDLISRVNPEKTIFIWNKCDVQKPVALYGFSHEIEVSAVTLEGFEKLKEHIEKIMWKNGPPKKNQVLITKVRHKESLEDACCHLSKVKKGLEEGISAEFISQDMKSALYCLSEIIGVNVNEEILSSIFSKFCVGK